MPITRVNLCTRPSLKTAQPAPLWSNPDTGWSRSTAMHATLPRTTGIAGTTPGDVYTAPGPVVPGRSYVGSISMRSISANTGAVQLAWVDEDNTVLSLSTAVPFTQGANTTVRLSAGPVVAPAGAVGVRIAVTGLDGSVQLTAALIEQATAAGGAYFDGDGPDAGARWSGADGNSPSAIGTNTPVVDLSYDDQFGRVRVLSSGSTALAGRVVVRRRPVTRTAYADVRGGEIAVLAGAAVRSADDYEFEANDPLIYRIDVYPGVAALAPSSVGGFPVAPLESLDVFFTPPVARGWVKFVANPYLNRKITVLDWSEIERPGRNAVYEVKARPDPVIVTAGHSSRRFDLVLRTWTRAETDALDESLKQGIPGFLHMPDDPDAAAPPTVYCVFGTYTHARPSRRSVGAVFKIPIIEVAAPPPSIFARGATWQTVLTEHTSWAALLAADETWQQVTS